MNNTKTRIIEIAKEITEGEIQKHVTKHNIQGYVDGSYTTLKYKGIEASSTYIEDDCHLVDEWLGEIEKILKEKRNEIVLNGKKYRLIEEEIPF